jgi:lipoprotein NlpD
MRKIERDIAYAFFITALFFGGCHSSFPTDLLPAVPDAEAVGIVHVVREGETLFSICQLYGADEQEVAEMNGIVTSGRVAVGQEIFIPDVSGPVSKSAQTKVPNGGERSVQQYHGEFIWPVAGVVTSTFGIRAGRRHDGIDIAAPEGTEIRASAKGVVLFSGAQGGYGNLLILRHENGTITVYAHNKINLASEDDRVEQGQVIAKIGTTGRTTGPHVHFEIRTGKNPRNPMFFLPKP